VLQRRSFRTWCVPGLGLALAAAALPLTASAAHATGVTVSTLGSSTASGGRLSDADLASSLAGEGVQVRNATHTGPSSAIGSFAGGGRAPYGVIGLTDGVVLGSGDTAIGESNTTSSRNTDASLSGDSDLDGLVRQSIKDYSGLEFDAKPTGHTITLDYVFASEEYDENIGSSFDDVFGFFVTEAGQATKTNCATVPGTTQPVSVNTINGGNPDGSSGTASHPELYRSNKRVGASSPIAAEADGFTVVLHCVARVVPGQWNHLKLAVGDASDTGGDSWAFLGAHSIVSGIVAQDDTATTDEDTAVTVPVLADDHDTQGDTLSVANATNGAHGNVTCDGTSCTYHPAADYHGADAFTYTVTNTKGDTAQATVNVTVASVNDAPVTTADRETTLEDTPVSFDVVGNDSDVDGDALTASVRTQPQHGQATCNGAACTYTPAHDFNGTDSFGYTAEDGHGGSTPGTVTVSVTPVQDAPVARPDAAQVDRGGHASIPVLINDSDPDGDPLTVVSSTQPAHGTVGCTARACSYTPAAAYSGHDSFSYTISDGQGHTSTSTVAMRVAPPPVQLVGHGTVHSRSLWRFTVSSGPGGGRLTVTRGGRHAVRFVGTSTTTPEQLRNSATWSGTGVLNRRSGWAFRVTAIDNGPQRRRGPRDLVSLTLTRPGSPTLHFGGRLRQGNLVVRSLR
jgi:hypothetical protein